MPLTDAAVVIVAFVAIALIVVLRTRADLANRREAWRAMLESGRMPDGVTLVEEAPDGVEHHHFYPWDEVKAHLKGGPDPRCRKCGHSTSEVA